MHWYEYMDRLSVDSTKLDSLGYGIIKTEQFRWTRMEFHEKVESPVNRIYANMELFAL